MILTATISRVNDGLPLSASTDVNQSKSAVVQGQKYVKIISKRASQFPDRCLVQGQGFYLFFVTALNVCCIVLSEAGFSPTVAFAFLEEIQKEFLKAFDPERVNNAQRPYAFIQFDTVLQKTRNRFNRAMSTSNMDQIVSVQEELAVHPPHRLTLSELEAVYGAPKSNGITEAFKSRVSPRKMFMPLTLIGFLSGILCLICSVLNLVRGMSIINDGHIDPGEGDDTYAFHDDKNVYKYATAFLMACLLCLYQVYLLTHSLYWRKYQAYLVLVFVLLCNFYLSSLRNIWQLGFHCSVCGFGTVAIVMRQLQGKLPEYNV